MLKFAVPVVVAAETTTGSSDAIKSAMTSAFQTVQSDSLDMIATALPFALGIITGVLVVTIGLKVFKKITGKA